MDVKNIQSLRKCKILTKMKKLFIAVAFIAASAFGVFQANQNNNQLSELQMDNLEALADYGEIINNCCKNAFFNNKWCDVVGVGAQSGSKCNGSCPYPCITGHM
ncbi:MAG: NVEALA domain-containing protein [Bacteroidales bacterium]|nr:NVEALA domain-containing protein [Bacteroidales bacterium]